MSSPVDILIEAPVEAAPYRKKAAVFKRKKDGALRAGVFTSSRTVNFQAQFSALAQHHQPPTIIEAPVRVDVLCVMSRPKRLLRRADPDGLMWAPGKPDADNMRKAVLDALKTWWRDDSLVVCGQTVRAYAEKDGSPRTVVRIRSLDAVDILSVVDPVFYTVPVIAPAETRAGGAL